MELSSHFTTLEFAPSCGVKPQTVHKGYCLNGHYLGIVPLKLPNGRLLWPRADVQALLARGAK